VRRASPQRHDSAVIRAQPAAKLPYGKNKLASWSDPKGELHLNLRF
jgi:hypothetical protein